LPDGDLQALQQHWQLTSEDPVETGQATLRLGDAARLVGHGGIDGFVGFELGRDPLQPLPLRRRPGP